MLTRIIASLALVPLFLFVVYGGIPLYIAETAIVYIALHEFYKAFKIKDVHPIFIIGYLFSIYLAVKNIFNLPLEYFYFIFSKYNLYVDGQKQCYRCFDYVFRSFLYRSIFRFYNYNYKWI